MGVASAIKAEKKGPGFREGDHRPPSTTKDETRAAARDDEAPPAQGLRDQIRGRTPQATAAITRAPCGLTETLHYTWRNTGPGGKSQKQGT